MAGRAGKARRTTCPWPPADRSCAARSSSEAADIDPLDLASDAVRRAQSEGADAAEAYAITFTSRSVYIEDDVPKVAEERSETGLGVRAAKAKRVAFSATTLASPADVRWAVGAAIAGLRRVAEDPDFSGLPTEAGKGEVRGAWDAATASTDTAGLLEAAKTFTDAVRESKATSVPKAIVRIQEYTFRVANSNGIVANHRGTLVFAYLTAKCGSKGKFGECILKAMNTSIRPIDFAALGATVARRASENLRARAVQCKLPRVAVLDPLDLGEILLTTVGSAANGEDVHKGRSPWAGKVGHDVASAGVTVRDRPRMQGGLASGVADDEGNATLIKKGELADHGKVALLTGNFYDGLKNVVGVGRALAPSHGFLTAPGCSYVPPMAFDGFELVGQA